MLSREIAMKLLYAEMVGGTATVSDCLEQSETDAPMKERDRAFADELVQGVKENMEELDACIQRNSSGRSLPHIAKVELCILRIAVFELLHLPAVPAGATINEAVELAKRFGGEHSSKYINGVLGAIAKECSI